MKNWEFQDEVGKENDPTREYEIVFWNGKERVPLVIEAIDNAARKIILDDARKYMNIAQGVVEDIADEMRGS